MARKGRSRVRRRRDAAFDARMRRLARLRTWVGAFGFVPLLAALACGSTSGAFPFCVVPREWLLAIWAGVFGTFIGLSIRMYRQRRRHALAEATHGRA
jgi:hypothetical protein